MENEKPENHTPRQWWLYRLVRWASENEIKLSVKDIIGYQDKYKEKGKLTFDDYYLFKDAEGNHSNCPQIYEDKDIINECDRLDKIICVKNNQFYLGNEREEIEYHNKLMGKVCDYSHKAKVIRDKISEEGQIKLISWDFLEIEKSKGRDYHQAFARQESLIKENEKLLKTIEKLKEEIKLYKNENQMWKDRYYYVTGNLGN